MAINRYISISTLNANKLHAPTRRHGMADQILKNRNKNKNKRPRPMYMLPTRNSFQIKTTHRLKVKGWKKDIPFKWK